MLIDWFTVGAQLLNFLILVWLLKRFLYKPVLGAIDAREKRIATELAEADAKKTEAQTERDAFRGKNEAFDRLRDKLLSEAQEEVKTERRRLLDEARQATDALRAKRQDALQRELQSLDDEITRRTREEVFAVARKTLEDLAGISLEERMSDVFVSRVRELDGEAKEHLAKALTTSAEPVLVRSAFVLSAEQRGSIKQALNETFSADIHLDFETAPKVLCGIELTANGRKIAWSIADHLSGLGKGVDGLLKEQSTSQWKSDASAELGPEAPEHEATNP